MHLLPKSGHISEQSLSTMMFIAESHSIPWLPEPFGVKVAQSGSSHYRMEAISSAKY